MIFNYKDLLIDLFKKRFFKLLMNMRLEQRLEQVEQARGANS